MISGIILFLGIFTLHTIPGMRSRVGLSSRIFTSYVWDIGLAIIPFSEILPSNMRLFNAATFIRAISPFFIFDISFSGTGIFI